MRKPLVKFGVSFLAFLAFGQAGAVDEPGVVDPKELNLCVTELTGKYDNPKLFYDPDSYRGGKFATYTKSEDGLITSVQLPSITMNFRKQFRMERKLGSGAIEMTPESKKMSSIRIPGLVYNTPTSEVMQHFGVEGPDTDSWARNTLLSFFSKQADLDLDVTSMQIEALGKAEVGHGLYLNDHYVKNYKLSLTTSRGPGPSYLVRFILPGEGSKNLRTDATKLVPGSLPAPLSAARIIQRKWTVYNWLNEFYEKNKSHFKNVHLLKLVYPELLSSGIFMFKLPANFDVKNIKTAKAVQPTEYSLSARMDIEGNDAGPGWDDYHALISAFNKTVFNGFKIFSVVYGSDLEITGHSFHTPRPFLDTFDGAKYFPYDNYFWESNGSAESPIQKIYLFDW